MIAGRRDARQASDRRGATGRTGRSDRDLSNANAAARIGG